MLAKGDICARCKDPKRKARWHYPLRAHLCKSCHKILTKRPLLKCEECGREGGVRKVKGKRTCLKCRLEVKIMVCDKCHGTRKVRKMRGRNEKLCKKCRKGYYRKPFRDFREAQREYGALRARSGLVLPAFKTVIGQLISGRAHPQAERARMYGCARQHVHQLDAKYFNEDIQSQFRARHAS